MPARQRAPRDPYGDCEQRDAGERNQEQRRKEPRYVELEAGEQDLIGKPRAASTRSRDEFGDDRTDKGKAARDPQAAEEVRQRARDAQAHEDLPPRCAAQPEQLEQGRIDAAQAERRVRNDRKDPKAELRHVSDPAARGNARLACWAGETTRGYSLTWQNQNRSKPGWPASNYCFATLTGY